MYYSYTRVKEIRLNKFEKLSIDTQQLGLHTLRAKGATVAANTGVLDSYSKNMGNGNHSELTMGILKIRLWKGCKFLNACLFRRIL